MYPTRVISSFRMPLSGPTWAVRVRILGNLHSGVGRALVPALFVRFDPAFGGEAVIVL
jgi:hypothetical protein